MMFAMRLLISVEEGSRPRTGNYLGGKPMAQTFCPFPPTMMLLRSSKKTTPGASSRSRANITSQFFRESALSLACAVGHRKKHEDADEEEDHTTIASTSSVSSPSSSPTTSASSRRPSRFSSRMGTYLDSAKHDVEVLHIGKTYPGDVDDDGASFESTKIEPDQVPDWVHAPRILPKQEKETNKATSETGHLSPPPKTLFYIAHEDPTSVSPPIAFKRMIQKKKEEEDTKKQVGLRKGRTVKSLLHGTNTNDNNKQDTPTPSPVAGRKISCNSQDIDNKEEDDDDEDDVKWVKTILKKPPQTVRVTQTKNHCPRENKCNDNSITENVRVVTWRLPSIEGYHSLATRTTSTTSGGSEASSSLDVLGSILDDWEEMKQQHQLPFLNCQATFLLCD
eukprot:scaffold4151_cov162-Amphora_coffeaeformis.AAC.11